MVGFWCTNSGFCAKHCRVPLQPILGDLGAVSRAGREKRSNESFQAFVSRAFSPDPTDCPWVFDCLQP